MIIGALALPRYRCDDAALAHFEQLSLPRQISAYKRANETHCPLEAGTRWYLERIGDHGDDAVAAVAPYLSITSKSSGFARMDALTVILHAAGRGADLTRTLPALRDIAAGKNGADQYDRRLAAMALERFASRRSTPSRW